MKRFKKLLCVVLAVMTMSVLFAGCGKNDGEANDSGSAEFEKIKVAYATNNVDETFVTMKNAYETVVGPTLNIEFMFSEALKDTGAMTTFIENAYAAGCQGVNVSFFIFSSFFLVFSLVFFFK